MTLRGDAEVTGIGDRSGGRVRVTFTDRTDGRKHRVDADYLLGCDGANSMVRDYIGSSMRDLRFEQRWLVIDVESPVDLRQWDGVHQLCDPRRGGTFMQIGDTRYRWEFQLLAGETADDFRTLPTLRPLIAPWISGLTDRDLTLIRVAEYTFRAQIADSWRRGTTFLLGDAAHLTPPFVGQGMCAGLRDAMNLSWKLAGVINTTLDASVLDTYEQERKPHVRKMIGLALLVGRVMTGGGRFGNLLRRTVVPRMHLIPSLRDRLLDSTTPPLPRTALVHKAPAAGTLCPNADTGDGHRLDSVLGNGFAVVSSHPLSAGDAAELGRRGAIGYLASPGSEVAEWLRATG